ncbi:MAG: deoxyribose-phosphate aldolase [Micrococcales bacterium]|nr:deoxyribose-phosphate aldolase [Micrococcales bacterium]
MSTTGQTTLSRSTLAHMIDYTLLRPEATKQDGALLVDQGQKMGVYGVCVSPSLLPLDGQGLKVVTVCGFPSGAHHPKVKAAEASLAAVHGADEVDMVVNLGAIYQDRWNLVDLEIAAVRTALPDAVVLKVIIESAALNASQIIKACQVAEQAGANFVKTSTGFHSAGGASPRAVELMAGAVGGRLGIKASGGIKTAADALALVAAGATRLGMSAPGAILDALV